VDAVSPILVDRAREPQGIRTTIVVSLFVHGAVAALVLFGPPLIPIDTAPHTVMTISLGGAAGAKTGGSTQMAGATTVKAEPDTKPSPAPPATAKPEMVIPKTITKAAPPPKATVKILQDEKTKALPRAAQASTGDARIQTSSKTQGFGLSSGGAGTGGYLDVQNFCCPEYLTTMIQLIQRNWNGQQDVPGQTLMKFTVMRDGRITSVQTERSSGYFALDQGAQRALLTTHQLPPLPAQFPDQSLTVHLNFQYVNH
jgi:TonB family protein